MINISKLEHIQAKYASRRIPFGDEIVDEQKLRINAALELAVEFSDAYNWSEKTFWVDQMVRALTGCLEDDITSLEYDRTTAKAIDWDRGRAP